MGWGQEVDLTVAAGLKHTACGQILTLLTETSHVHPKHEETTHYMLLNKASLRYSVTFNGN